MARVKSFYHDEICGVADIIATAPNLKQAARELLARRVAKPRDVADILDGKWDDTPAFRKTYGEVWLLDGGPA